MGGDFAPRAPIAGALHALAELDEVHVVQLVGRISLIEKELGELLAGELADHASVRDRIFLVDAPDTIIDDRQAHHCFAQRVEQSDGRRLEVAG